MTKVIISYFFIFLSSFTVALTGAMMPGPLLTAAISDSLKKGFVAGPLLIVGHGILELTLLVALLWGLSPLFTQKWFFVTVSLAGGFILFLMAWFIFQSLPHLSVGGGRGEKAVSPNLVAKGIVISLSNPYFLIWWATIGMGYIVQSQTYGFLGISLFFLGHILADALWYCSVTFAMARGRNFMTPKLYRMIMGTAACFLVGFGTYFMYAGMEKIL